MSLKKSLLVWATSTAVVALSVSSVHAVPASLLSNQKSCSSKAAAKAFADSLAVNIRNAFEPDVKNGTISRPSVSVAFNERGAAPKTEVNLASEVTFQITSAPITGKITLQGAPTAATLYQLCTPPKTQFRISIRYFWNDTKNAKRIPISIRETFETVLPGQYL